MASIWEDPEFLLRLGGGLLAASGPSTDPSHASLGAAFGKSGLSALQGYQENKRANAALGIQQDQVQMAKNKALREAGMAAQAGAWWAEGQPKTDFKKGINANDPATISTAYRALGDRLMSAGNIEPAKAAYEQAKMYQAKYSAPTPMMQPNGQLAMVQPSDIGAPKVLEGFAPKPNWQVSNQGGFQRVFNADSSNPGVGFIDWSKTTSPDELLRSQTQRDISKLALADDPVTGKKVVADLPAGTARPVRMVPATPGPGELLAAPENLPIQYKQKREAILNMGQGVNSLRENIKTLGPGAAIPGTPENTKAGTIFTDLQMQAKGVFELGAITGPDMKVLDGFVSDPRGAISTISRAVAGDKAAMAQLDEIDRILERNKTNLDKVYRPYMQGQQQSNVAASRDAAKPGQQYTAPDGSIRVRK